MGQLIAPAISAMYVANVQLKLMQSFVNSPQVHIIALKNPAMFSGPLALLQDVLAEALRLAGFRGLFMPQLREQGVALDELQGRFELQTDQANTIYMV